MSISSFARFAPYCRVILLACSYRGLWEILSVIIAIVPEVFDLGVIIEAMTTMLVLVQARARRRPPSKTRPCARPPPRPRRAAACRRVTV